jgi:hypothetical protein
MLHVVLGGAFRQHERLGDLPVRQATRDQLRDLRLARSQL